MGQLAATLSAGWLWAGWLWAGWLWAVAPRARPALPSLSWSARRSRPREGGLAVPGRREAQLALLPLLHGAAVALDRHAPTADAEVAAAKAACGEAAYAASRTALQLHGAIGYTREMDLALWIGKARALRSAWGTPAACPARALEGLPAAL